MLVHKDNETQKLNVRAEPAGYAQMRDISSWLLSGKDGPGLMISCQELFPHCFLFYGHKDTKICL